MRILKRGALVLFVLAIPLFLVTTSVTWALNDLRLYRYGFDKYQVSADTGIEKEDLMQAAREVRGYFNSRHEPLAIRTRVDGRERELFNQREVSHMRDVKRLVWGVYGVGTISGLYLLGFCAFGLMRQRPRFGRLLAYLTLWGTGFTVALITLVGLVSLVAFDQLFLLFHRVSFANDFWQLDPSSDFLVMMFPQGFWSDATLFVGLAAVGLSLALALVSAGFLLWRRRKARKETKPAWPAPEKAARV